MTVATVLSGICISLANHLPDRPGEIIHYRGYSSRSEGIRDAIRRYILHYPWMAEVKGETRGVITRIDHRTACRAHGYPAGISPRFSGNPPRTCNRKTVVVK